MLQCSNKNNCGDVFISCNIEDDDDNLDADVVEQAAEMVYGLIHMRFVLTNAGIVKMVIYWNPRNSYRVLFFVLN